MREKAVIEKAQQIIKTKTADTNKWSGVTLSLLNSEGYPTTSSISIAKANDLHELTFTVGTNSNKANRIKECNRASVCIFDDNFEQGSYYNITLVGDIEIITDPEIKKANWYDGLQEHFPDGASDPNYCVLKFVTKHYNLWFYEEGGEVRGSF